MKFTILLLFGLLIGGLTKTTDTNDDVVLRAGGLKGPDCALPGNTCGGSAEVEVERWVGHED
jgi:hypothetical protein